MSKSSKAKNNTNNNVDSLNRQIQNTLERLSKQNIVYHYYCPNVEKICGTKGEHLARLSWNNHRSGRATEKDFLKVSQYLSLLEDASYLAIMADYSIVRCSFTFDKNVLVAETLLWWPCPVEISDDESVDKYGLVEVTKSMMKDPDFYLNLKMRSPIRIDFDPDNNTEKHPQAHMHIEDRETRINTEIPICFNRFMEFILKNFYPRVKVSFSQSEYIHFSIPSTNGSRYRNLSYKTSTLQF